VQQAASVTDRGRLHSSQVTVNTQFTSHSYTPSHATCHVKVLQQFKHFILDVTTSERKLKQLQLLKKFCNSCKTFLNHSYM